MAFFNPIPAIKAFRRKFDSLMRRWRGVQRTENEEVPFPNAYWVVPFRLLAGEYPGAPDPDSARKKIEKLLDCGIRHVINLMELEEKDYLGRPFLRYEDILTRVAEERKIEVTLERFKIPDMGVPDPKTMRAVLDSIERGISSGKPVYLHCLAGAGRTGTVVGCYLIDRKLVSYETVIEHIRDLRRNTEIRHIASPQTSEQLEMIMSWNPSEQRRTH